MDGLFELNVEIMSSKNIYAAAIEIFDSHI